MSHATDWTCRSCRAILGRVRDGELDPLESADSIDATDPWLMPRPGRSRFNSPGSTCSQVSRQW
jgi:hypothetical protein